MNVSSSSLSTSLQALLANSSNPTGTSQSQNSLASYLNADAGTTGDSSDLDSLFDSSDSSSLQLSSGVQSATSFVQASQSGLTSLASTLSQMAALAKDAQSAGSGSTEAQSDATQFAKLQQQLRSEIGGSTSEIGGTSDVEPSATQDGTALFGANATHFTIATGLSSAPTMAVNGVNLRQGSMLSLIQQDGSGNFSASLSDSGTLATIQQAEQQVNAGQNTLSTTSSQLSATSATLDIQSMNLASMMSSIDAQSATSSVADPSFLSYSSQANLNANDVSSLLGS